jgi:hypothetical protein
MSRPISPLLGRKLTEARTRSGTGQGPHLFAAEPHHRAAGAAREASMTNGARRSAAPNRPRELQAGERLTEPPLQLVQVATRAMREPPLEWLPFTCSNVARSFAPRFSDWGPRVADGDDDDNADR